MQKAEDYQTCLETVGPWQIRIRSYRLGDEYVCVVDNVNPGANLARARAPSREAAEAQAAAKAKALISRTKIHQAK